MKALVLLPNLSQREKNDIIIALNGANMRFLICLSPEKILEAAAALAPEKALVIIEACDCVQVLPALPEGSKAIIFTKTNLEELPPEILKSSSFASLIPMHKPEIDFCDFLLTIQKHATNNIFGLKQHLLGGAAIYSYKISNSEERRAAIELVSKFVSKLGNKLNSNRFALYGQRIADGLDELLLNAVFDANPRMLAERREFDFTLSDEESVKICWAFDGLTFGFSVEDKFGRLTKATALAHISKVIKVEELVQQKSGGMGLQLTYRRMHKVVCNVAPDQRTEVLCFLKFLPSLKDYDAQMKTFHFFSTSADQT